MDIVHRQQRGLRESTRCDCYTAPLITLLFPYVVDCEGTIIVARNVEYTNVSLRLFDLFDAAIPHLTAILDRQLLALEDNNGIDIVACEKCYHDLFSFVMNCV